MGIFSAIAAVFKLASSALAAWVRARIFRAGRDAEKMEQQEERLEGQREAHKSSEEWKKGGGLGGAAVRGRVPKSSDRD